MIIPNGVKVTGIITTMTKPVGIIASVITAALVAAVFFACDRLPSYSEPSDKIVKHSEANVVIEQKGRGITVRAHNDLIWELEDEVSAQDFLFEDIDHDGVKELLVLCWKKGRFGKKKPTWVEEDETDWSQHIFIYEVENDTVKPKWMASDIGMKAQSWSFLDGVLSITDTDGVVSKWIWRSWGLEKL